jgi:hypothetical protein
MCKNKHVGRPRAVTRRSAAPLLRDLGSNPAGSMDVCLLCRVFSGRGFYVGLIIHPEESYRGRVTECYQVQLTSTPTVSR